MAGKLEKTAARNDREIAAIRKLVFGGMKIVVETGMSRLEGQQETMRKDMREIHAAQKKTGCQAADFYQSGAAATATPGCIKQAARFCQGQ